MQLRIDRKLCCCCCYGSYHIGLY